MVRIVFLVELRSQYVSMRSVFHRLLHIDFPIWEITISIKCIAFYSIFPDISPSVGELAGSPTIGHDLRVVYTQIFIG